MKVMMNANSILNNTKPGISDEGQHLVNIVTRGYGKETNGKLGDKLLRD